MINDDASSLVNELLEVSNPERVEDPALVVELTAVRSRLSEPLRVVLAGRVSSGKSTLLNALLHQKIAPTDASDCTRVATWFRFGRPEQIEVRLTSGRTTEMQLGGDGLLPSYFDVPNEQIQDIRVTLTNDALRDFTFIDTPGFSTGEVEAPGGVDDEIMDRRTRDAAANCDAMLLVFDQTLRAMSCKCCAPSSRVTTAPCRQSTQSVHSAKRTCCPMRQSILSNRPGLWPSDSPIDTRDTSPMWFP